MTLAIERMGKGVGAWMELRKEAPVRVQGGAAGDLDLHGVDRGGEIRSDLESKGAAEKVC